MLFYGHLDILGSLCSRISVDHGTGVMTGQNLRKSDRSFLGAVDRSFHPIPVI